VSGLMLAPTTRSRRQPCFTPRALLAALIAASLGTVSASPTHASGQLPLPGNPAFTDADRDGIPDEFERSFRVNSLTDTDDSDVDGYRDGREIAQGRDPNDPFDTPEQQGARRALRIAILPMDAERFAILLIAWSPTAFRDLSDLGIAFRVHDRTHDVTRSFLAAGQRLHSADGETRTLAVLLDRLAIVGRTEVLAEMTVDGRRHQGVAIFGEVNDVLFQARLRPSAEENTLLAEYEFLTDQGGVQLLTTGGNEPNKIFQEVLYIFNNGRYIVVRNNCDERPNETCPSFLNTVGQTGRLGRR
jgi:hypothetical protein